MNYMIQTENLTKKLGNQNVIQDVNLHVQQGEIYGFLGPNGSGKTTIMKMLLNLLKPSAGDILINGKRISPKHVMYLKNIGSLIEYPIFYEELTANENLHLHCAYMGTNSLSEIDPILRQVGLENINHKKVKDFSLGMRQRLAIARAILTKPTLLILDEPINGLDPVGIKQMRELFITLKKQYGMTIFISSHIVSELESIADTVGILNNGRLIKEFSMTELHAQKGRIKLITNNVSQAKSLLENQLTLKVEQQEQTLFIERPHIHIQFLLKMYGPSPHRLFPVQVFSNHLITLSYSTCNLLITHNPNSNIF